MKKVVGLAAAGLLAVSAANAGNLTIANTDMVLFGGVSAGFTWQSADRHDGVCGSTPPCGVGLAQKDFFSVNTFAIGLTKPATEKSPLGFTAALASFEVPVIFASSDVVNDAIVDPITGKRGLIAHGRTSGSFKPWLAFVSWIPVPGLTIDAGLLWDQFGERALTILNPNIHRGVVFTAHPVLFAGARATYDLGMAKVYLGYNQGGGLLQGVIGVSDAFEAGVLFNVENIAIGLHTYDEAMGRNLYVLEAKGKVGEIGAGLELDYIRKDDSIQAPGVDDSAWGVAINVNPSLGDIALPIRVEYVSNGNSGLFLTGNDTTWTFTITPTYKPTANTFVRVELGYVSSDQDVYYESPGDEPGNGTSSRTVASLELGFAF